MLREHTMPQVTIGVPFYNCHRYLLNTIKSIYSQCFTDWEVIFVDDGSTDASLSIVESIRDSRVTVYSDGRNLGIGARRKQIVDLAKGKYLAWQDADDMMHPDRLRIQCEYLESHKEIDLVDCSVYLMGPDLRIFGLDQRSGPVDSSRMAEFAPMTNGASMARLEMYRRFPFDGSLRRVEDWDLWIRASKYCSFYHLAEALYYKLDADDSRKPRMDRELTEPRYFLVTYLKYGQEYLGRTRYWYFIARLCLRTIYRVVIITAGCHKLLKDSRSTVISAETKSTAEMSVKAICETKVPGMVL
jgi:glycosyltransferase involved in cell wall biosynthesis